MQISVRGSALVLYALVLGACTPAAVILPTPTVPAVATASPLPPTTTALPTFPAETPTPAGPVGSAARPLRVRIIQSDVTAAERLQPILEAAAADAGVAVTVAITTADAAYALAQDPSTAAKTDVYVGNQYDLTQLQRSGAVASGQPAAPSDTYPFVGDFTAVFPAHAVYPFAGQNYLLSIANADLLAALPASTDEWFQIDPNTRGRTRYDVAYAWGEGRWFDAVVRAQANQSATDEATPPADALTAALTEWQALRRLGPRDVTSYQEATVDFVNWRVPYTLDTDAALRRYQVYSQTLTLAYAAPPQLSLSGTPLNPPIDVVSVIVAASADPAVGSVAAQFASALLRPAQQVRIVNELYWLPVSAQTYAQIDITKNPESAVLAVLAPAYRVQRYTPRLICRWDAYEQVLPGVLLRETDVDSAVSALESLLDACGKP